jgi:hypothetical protein
VPATPGWRNDLFAGAAVGLRADAPTAGAIASWTRADWAAHGRTRRSASFDVPHRRGESAPGRLKKFGYGIGVRPVSLAP